MKNLIRFGLFSFFLLSDFIMFAQGGPGDDGDGDGGTEGGDPQPAPINSKLIYLAIIGIVYAIYLYKNKTKRIV